MIKEVIIYCDGGLANRINCLANGLVIANMLQQKYKIYWPINRYCESKLTEIIEIEMETQNLGKQVLKNRSRCLIVADENFISAPEDLWINPRRPRNFKEAESEIIDAAKKVEAIIIFYPIPFYEKYKEFRLEIKNLFNPKPEIMDLVRETELQMKIPEKYWGLHMRGTDAKKNNKYYKFFKLLTKLIPGKYYLASDDCELIEFFSDRPNVIKRENINFPSKAELNATWTSKNLDENGDILPYNVRRTSDSIRDAMVDLLILSKSNLIPTSTSTYLELAANISDRKMSFIPQLFLVRHKFKMLMLNINGNIFSKIIPSNNV